jgi:hypothetical protein
VTTGSALAGNRPRGGQRPPGLGCHLAPIAGAPVAVNTVSFIGLSKKLLVRMTSPMRLELKGGKPIFVGPLKDNKGNVVITKALGLYDPVLWQTNYLLDGIVGSIT